MLTESKGSSSSSSLYSSLGKRLGLAGKMGEQDNDPRLALLAGQRGVTRGLVGHTPSKKTLGQAKKTSFNEQG